MRLRSKDMFADVMTRRGMTVRGLAEAVGLKGHGMIQQLRDGRRPGCKEATAKAIAKELDVKTNYLFDAQLSSNALPGGAKSSTVTGSTTDGCG